MPPRRCRARRKQPAELKFDEKLTWSPGRGSNVWALFQACIAGDLTAVQALIARDPSLARAHYDVGKGAAREKNFRIVRVHRCGEQEVAMTMAKASGTVVVCLGMVLLLQAVELAGQKGGGARNDTPVISLLEDRGSVADSTNYRIQSDGLGVYVHSTSKTDPVTSIIQTHNTCCQDWELSTMSSSTRGMLVDFRDPVPGTGANPPVDWQIAGGRVLVQCHNISSTSFPGMSPGQSLDCPVVVNVDAPSPARTGWRISLGHAGQPGTDPAHVICVAADASGCSEWTVESTAVHDLELKNVGRLLLARGNEILGSYGDYYFSFSFRVTR